MIMSPWWVEEGRLEVFYGERGVRVMEEGRV
jgi:hypothetical protein